MDYPTTNQGNFNRATHTMTIHPGSVLWIRHHIQSLAPAQQLEAQGQITKARPVVAVKKTIVAVDRDHICTDDTFMLAIDSTSQEKLTAGRPSVNCKISSRDPRISHFWLDTLSTINLKNEQIRVTYAMTLEEKAALQKGLQDVLQPEQRFFLSSLFKLSTKRAAMPGDVYSVEIPCNESGRYTKEVDALVLIKRGAFFLNEDAQGRLHFTPFLVAVLPDRFRVQDMRGLRWNDLRLMALHDRSIKYPIGKISDETIGVLLNTLRREIELPLIAYQRPLIRHLFSWLHPFVMAPLPRPGVF